VSRVALIGLLAGSILALGLGVVGYAIGSSSAADSQEARAARASAYKEAYATARAAAYQRSARRGRQEGVSRGQREARRDGTNDGAEAGQAQASQQAADAQAAATPASGLTYVPELPNGRPGYALPLEERTLACVGFDAETGECVGD
jgi:hypothetical protein